MKLKNKVYDVLKYTVLVFLPALTTFVGVILKCFNYEHIDIVLTIMVGFTTFLGTLIGVSCYNYKKGE